MYTTVQMKLQTLNEELTAPLLPQNDAGVMGTSLVADLFGQNNTK